MALNYVIDFNIELCYNLFEKIGTELWIHLSCTHLGMAFDDCENKLWFLGYISYRV